jgi:hypothetical protein
MEGSKGTVSLTPEQMSESITRFLQSVDSSDPKDLANKLFQEDGEFSELLIRSAPGIVGAVTQIVKSFAESLENMPAEKSTELLASSLSQVDGKEIGEAVNSISRLYIRLHEQDPEFYPEKKLGIASGVVEEVDFGKLRKAIIFRNQERMELLRSEVEMMGEEPMAIINLFSVVTPMVNNFIEVLNAAFETLEMPSEATAYAVFKILQDINWKEISSVVNGLAGLTVTLHRGNLILGDGSLESRTVFSRISEDIIANLDPQAVAEAIQAIGEEGEAFITSFADAALENEELTLWMTGAMTAVANSYLTAVANILAKLNTLPPETVRKITDGIAEDFEARELGRALNSLVVLGGRLRSENPELLGTILRNTLAAANLDEILNPEAIGAGVNQTLVSYNKLSRENPRLVTESLDGFLAGIDARQLGEAAQSTASQMAEATSRHPEVMKVLLKALISMAYKTVRGYISNLWSNGRKRQGEVKVG